MTILAILLMITLGLEIEAFTTIDVTSFWTNLHSLISILLGSVFMCLCPLWAIFIGLLDDKNPPTENQKNMLNTLLEIYLSEFRWYRRRKGGRWYLVQGAPTSEWGDPATWSRLGPGNEEDLVRMEDWA